MKIAITGATGFIGSSLIKNLQNQYQIQALSRRPIIENSKNIKWIIGDLLSEEICLELLKDTEVLIHLAQSNSPLASDEDLVTDANLNLLPTLKLLNTIKKYRKKLYIIYASSGGAVYGNNPNSQKFKETDPCFPNSAYGIQKLAIENYLRIMSESQEIKSTVLRIGNPYGVLLPISRKQGLIGVVLNRILNKQKIQIIGNPNNIRDYIHLDDLMKAFNLIINYKPSNYNYEVFNIASGIGYSVNEIIELIEKNFSEYQIQKDYINNTNTDNLVNCSILDISKANKVLNWHPEILLEQGIKSMYQS